jgi:hypothetical protein
MGVGMENREGVIRASIGKHDQQALAAIAQRIVPIDARAEIRAEGFRSFKFLCVFPYPVFRERKILLG